MPGFVSIAEGSWSEIPETRVSGRLLAYEAGVDTFHACGSVVEVGKLSWRLRAFFASAPQRIHPIQTLQISHSAMTQTWTLWREPYVGQVTTEAGLVTVQPANIEITLAGNLGHLDQQFIIKLGLVDIEDEFRREMDAVPIDTREKVQIVYREYLSDDLTTAQATARLQMEAISYVIGAANISAASPRLNITRTGELYAPKDVPMLRAFL